LKKFSEIAFAFSKLTDVASQHFMKTLLSACAVSLLAASAFADIQDPPMNDLGPTRKLGRGLANISFAVTEIPYNLCEMNEREGNAASASYGMVKGVGRFFARIGFGVYEVATFPFPTSRSSYRPPYKSNIPWIHGGYDEFPPELGFETRYRYVRSYYAY
jgi:putative exosortase-associated protein (TIGR04073 family)